MITDTEDLPREAAMIRALGSISKVLGKENEFQQFLSYVDSAGRDKMPSKTDVANHTPTWVQLVMPLLGKLYDNGYYDGQKAEGEAFRRTRQDSKVL